MQNIRLWMSALFIAAGLGWAQVDSAYIRMKELGISPPAPPLPPGTPRPLSNPASDCPGAIRICQAVYSFSQAVPDYGSTQELPGGAGTCLLAGEHRSVWFIFTVQQGGTLGFIIDPGSFTDYDFALWDVTGLSNPCSAIGSIPPIRCNYSANSSTTSCCGGYTGGPGITGLDHTNPQPGTISNPAGGAPIMPGLNVTAGQTFLLVVDNFSNTTQGYTITFTGTAQYADNTSPRMDSTSQFCASSYDSQVDNLRQILVRFNELISPSTVAADGSDFVVQEVATGALVPVVAASAVNPPQTNTVRITTGVLLMPGNTYKIRIGYNPPGSGSTNGQPGSDGNTIGDQCGISIPLANVPEGASADSILLVVRDTLTPVISLTPPTCAGTASGQVSVSVTGGIPPYQYALVSGNSNTPPGAAAWSSNNSFTNRAAGTYTLWMRDAAGCVIRRVVQLIDPPSVSIVITDSADVGCAPGGGRVTFSGQGGTPPYEYSILPPYPTWQSGNTFTGLAAGTYTLRVRDANGCVATRSFTIRVLPPLTVQATDTTPILCAGQTGGFSVQASGGTPPYTYTLDGTGISNSTGIFTGLQAGTYTVRVYDNPRDQCGYITITLTEPDSLRVDSTIKPVTCKGGQDGEIRVTITGGTTPYTLLWQGADGTPLPQTGSTLSNLAEGTYSLTVTDANGCTLGPLSFTVPHSYEVVLDSLIYALVNDCPLKEYQFTASVRGTPPFVYRWFWEDGTVEVGSDSMRRSLSPLLGGEVTIRLQVESPGPCYAETTLTFLSEACSGILIHNVFTPNGDGINDTWKVQALGFRRYTLIVYDRWGREVFNNGGDMNKLWDGTIGGQPAPEGAYSFVFEGTDLNGQKVTRTGTVTLLR